MTPTKTTKTTKTKGKITSSREDRVAFNPKCEPVKDPVSGTIRRGRYAHFCWEHNDMLIDETDPEFANCLCGKRR